MFLLVRPEFLMASFGARLKVWNSRLECSCRIRVWRQKVHSLATRIENLGTAASDDLVNSFVCLPTWWHVSISSEGQCVWVHRIMSFPQIFSSTHNRIHMTEYDIAAGIRLDEPIALASPVHPSRDTRVSTASCLSPQGLRLFLICFTCMLYDSVASLSLAPYIFYKPSRY